MGGGVPGHSAWSMGRTAPLLVERAWDWPFSGAVFAGYPSLWPFDEDYWPLFWKPD